MAAAGTSSPPIRSGEKAGVVSGAALLVDYILTITVSIVSCGAAIFSFFPPDWQPYKIPFDLCAIVLLVVLNLRESRNRSPP